MASPTIQLGDSGSAPFVIAFRGDNRDPKRLFISGFNRQNTSGPINYRKGIGFPGEINSLMPGDIQPESAVTFSKRIRVAAMFPLKEGPSDPSVSLTYVYIFAVEPSVIYNTHQKQIEDGLKGIERWGDSGHNIDDLAAKILMWPLYAQEMAALRIPSSDIIAAIACRRTWRGFSYKDGMAFKLEGEILWNPQCSLPRGLKNMASQFFEREVKDFSEGTSPQTESGYHKSEKV